MTGILDRLRISGPPTSPQEAAEAKRAVCEGRDLLRWEGVPAPSLQSVIWRLLVEATETLGRIDDAESRWLGAGRIWWPAVLHTDQEEFEAEVFRMQVLREERSQPQPPRLRNSDPRAESRMMTVLGWLKYIRSATPLRLKRDKMVVLSLASGEGLARTRARYFPRDGSDSAPKWVKSKALRQIELALVAMGADS